MILEVFSCFDGSMILWYWLHFKQIHQSAFHWIYSTWKRIIQNLKKYTVLNHVIVYFPYCIYYYDCINQCVNRKCIQKKKEKKNEECNFLKIFWQWFNWQYHVFSCYKKICSLKTHIKYRICYAQYNVLFKSHGVLSFIDF